MLALGQDHIKKIPAERGCFVEFSAGEEFSEQSFYVGALSGLQKYTAVYRFNACWMAPCCGKDELQDLDEIQYLIATDGKKYCLLYALIDECCRTSLYIREGKLYALCETGDEDTRVVSTVGLYCIEGTDPYQLNRLAHVEIVRKLGTCELIENKIKPQFAEKFGFCTYNAFYDDVTEENLEKLLDVFEKEGIGVGFLLIDAGWQSTQGDKLAAFEPDPKKFPNGLKKTVERLKEKYGLSQVFCWHTFIGFWTGFVKENFPEYKIDYIDFFIPKHTRKLMDKIERSDTTATAGFNFYATNTIHQKWGVVGTDLYRFYFDFYSYLRKQGVDGSKLDAMCWIEGLGQHRGGRVRQMRQLISSLEGASAINFGMEHINCSSCSNDFIYNSLRSSVIRSSTDFFENIDESHGLHLFTNAHTSFWLDELFIPDWDMFMSGINAGEYHAMARAISGGPIYCSDNLKSVDFDIIRKLTDGKGGLGKCVCAARVTQDNLFTDPVHEKKLLKVFNRNKYGYVLGAFCCYYDKNENVRVRDTLRLQEIHGLPKGNYAVYSYRKGYLGIYPESASFEVELGRFEGDIFTVVPVRGGVAAIGIAEKYNPTGFIARKTMQKGKLTLEVKAAGTLLIVSAEKPVSANVEFSYEGGMISAPCAAGKVEFTF